VDDLKITKPEIKNTGDGARPGYTLKQQWVKSSLHHEIQLSAMQSQANCIGITDNPEVCANRNMGIHT